MNLNSKIVITFILFSAFIGGCHAFAEEIRPEKIVYRGELCAFPDQWALRIPRAAIILTSDHDLEVISSNPDQPIDVSMTFEKEISSLRQKCEKAKKIGAQTLIVAFDHFFKQYRTGQDHPRTLMPDMDEYIEKIAKVSKFAESYGLGLELSLLTPLEIGRAYRKATGESGVWMQYRKGLRDPKTGAFSVQLWRQKKWINNKGAFEIEDAGVRVFAFRESTLPAIPYRVVPEDSIEEITEDVHVETLGEPTASFPATRIRVYGKGKTKLGDLNRVLVVQSYRTPELDFFSDKAKDYLKKLIDRYADAGVKLNALYSDEPHLMADWSYHAHHEHGQFAMRFVSPGFINKFSKKYGEKYRDFAKYLVYFTYGQEDFAHDTSATLGVMHTWGASPEAIRQTALFRSRYYHFLQENLTNFFVEAKHYAEKRVGHRLEARGHATWAESPTCDYWLPVAGDNGFRRKYEYTSDFVWSNTIQQASVACSDYFCWGDFLTGNGNDHAEGGFLDRNYFGLALACSTGILNDTPYSYACSWGMPQKVKDRHGMLSECFGVAGSHYGDVEDLQHRDVDVLMLYPFDLVAVEEKFGSWMTQYPYANYVTQGKLLERGRVVNGAIEMAGRRFSTLATTFEPFPSKALLDMMEKFVLQGGRVIWSGPPPVFTAEGEDALGPWSAIFGVGYQPNYGEGIPAPGQQIVFSNELSRVPPQIILTHELIDHIYPVTPLNQAQPIAQVQNRVVGTIRKLNNGGMAAFLGFRPRDDQSCSLGYDVRTWFEILNALGAYPPSGKFPGVQDNTEYLSRTGDLMACHFPNGTVAITPHLRLLEEAWPGNFARDDVEDAKYLANHLLPTAKLELKDFKVHGHKVSYDGIGTVAFRLSKKDQLIAFAGRNCCSITVDGQTWTFSEKPIQFLAFNPLDESRRVPGGALYSIFTHGNGTVRIPISELPATLKIFVEGETPGSKGDEIPCCQEGRSLIFEVTPTNSGRHLWVIKAGGGKHSRQGSL